MRDDSGASMVTKPGNQKSCSCVACLPTNRESALLKSRRGVLFGLFLTAGYAVVRNAIAADDLLDPTKIGVPRAPAASADLLPPSSVGVGAAGPSAGAQSGRTALQSTSYPRSMAESVVRTLNGLTNECSLLVARIQSMDGRLSELAQQLSTLQAEMESKMEEYRNGLFCSGCGQTKSEILAKGEKFPHPGQQIIRPTRRQIADKESELQRPIDRTSREADKLKDERKANYDKREMALRQIDAGVALWRTSISYEHALISGNEEKSSANYTAESNHADDQIRKLRVEVLANKDKSKQAGLASELALWTDIKQRAERQRAADRQAIQASLSSAGSMAGRESAQLNEYLNRDPLRQVLTLVATPSLVGPKAGFNALGGFYRMGDFNPAKNDEVLPSVRTFIAQYAAAPAVNCVAIGAGLGCSVGTSGATARPSTNEPQRKAN